MRLDLFLKVSRLLPRRTLAQEYCDKGLVRVNGVPAKSSKTIAPDDEIEIIRKELIVVVRVLSVPPSKQVSKEAASGLYLIVSETSRDEP